MSVEEDTELRDLVAQTLETNGCLAKIRAQLRASVFLALEDDEQLQKKQPLLNKKVKEHLESQQGRLMFCLVREFLEYFNLEFTISVYEPESYMGTQYHYEGRSNLVHDLKISQLDDKSPLPLLLQLIQIAHSRSSQQTSENNSKSSMNYEKSDQQINNLNLSNTLILEQEHQNHVTNTNNLNETFSIVNQQNESDVVLETNTQDKIKQPNDAVILSSNKEKDDNTFEGTSSLTEDSIQEENIHHSISTDNESEKLKESPSQTVSDADISPIVAKDCKFSKLDLTYDKLKLSPQKSEKIKARTSLSSVSDLPPLSTINKTRCNDMLLPSLYTKEFKEKSNCRDIDKIFDLNALDNYEEDFMSSNEADLVHKKGNISPVNNSPEVEKHSKSYSDSEVDTLTDNKDETSTNSNKSRKLNDSSTSSIASDDFEVNTNVNSN